MIVEQLDAPPDARRAINALDAPARRSHRAGRMARRLCRRVRAEFLEVPQECLILTMKANQKYFPLFDGAGKLLNRFLIVSNMQVADPANIITGNARVVRPRLSDAASSSTRTDKKRLEARVPQAGAGGLSQQARLPGRPRRQRLGAGRCDRRQARRRRRGEARGAAGQGRPRDRHGRRVPRAAGHHGPLLRARRRRGRRWWPTPSSPLPAALRRRRAAAGNIACAVALADKLDALVGFFGIGQVPTGDKDPFGLRRAALGVLRILMEAPLPLDLPGADRRPPRPASGAGPAHGEAASPASCSTSCSSVCEHCCETPAMTAP
jgi:glycyl-tRNA synthetase beta chain